MFIKTNWKNKNNLLKLQFYFGLLMKNKIFFIVIWLLLYRNSFSQTYAYDCIGAIPVCQTIYSQPNSFSGEGAPPYDEEINSTTSCLSSGEKNGVWYIFTVTQSGNLGFLITPNNLSDDYDWAVFNLSNASCADIFNNPSLQVSCNYSGTSGTTGANGGSFSNNQNAAGTPYNAFIPVNVGETYVLYVSNFSSSQDGYTLDFGLSTASIFDTIPPNLTEYLGISCSRNQIKFKISENILCDSIAYMSQNASSCVFLNGPGGPYTVDSVVGGAICSSSLQNAISDTLTIYFSPPITVGGQYDINITCGLRDACGNSGNGNLTFNVTPGAAVIVSGDQTLCEGESTQLTATGASNFTWFPGGFVGPTIIVTPSQSTIYKIVPTDGPCQGDTVYYPVTVFPAPSTALNAPSSLCRADTAIIQYTDSVYTGMNFVWNFDNGIVVSGSGPGPYEVIWTSTGVKNLTLSVTQGPCSKDTAFSIQINDKPIVDAGNDVAICKGSSVMLQGNIFQGNSGCTVSWTPTLGLDNPSVLNPLATPDTTTVYYLTADCQGCVPDVMDSVRVEVNPRPTVTFSQVQYAVCQGQGGVQIQANVNANGTPIFEWIPTTGLSNPFIANPIANPTVTTLYSLVVRDGFGCPSDTAKVLVMVDTVPVANAGPDFYICEGSGQGVYLQGSATGGAGSYSFLWTPSTGLSDSTIATPYATPDTTTVYTLMVISNLSGCSSNPTTLDTLSTVTVHVVPQPIANAGPDKSVCPGDSVQIGEIPNGGSSGYIYLWQPSMGLSDSTAQLPMASPPFTTTYFLTVFSNGCQSVVDSVVVTVNPRPTAAVVHSIEEICPGDSVQLQGFATNPSSGPFSYRWVPGTGLNDSTVANPWASPTDTTLYTLYVSYEGCEGSPATVTVNVRPIPQIWADSTQNPNGLFICYGDSIRIPAKSISSLQPVTYQWLPVNDLSSPNVLNPIAKHLETTTYYLYATLGQCTVVDSVKITVSPAINPQIFASKDTICQRDTLHLIANGGVGSATFEWFSVPNRFEGNGSILIVGPETTITYYVLITEGLCTDVDSFTVYVKNKPLTQFTYSFEKGCSGMEVSFQDLSTNADAWIWDFGDGTSVVNVQNPYHVYEKPGVYRVRLTTFAFGGCQDTSTQEAFITVEPTVKPGFLSNQNTDSIMYLPDVFVQFTDTTQGALTWFWDFGNGTSSTERNPTVQYLLPGEYTVTLVVTTAQGCTYSISKGKFIVVEPTTTFYNVITPNGDFVNDVWKVDYKGEEPVSFVIYDRWGRVVGKGDSASDTWQAKDLNHKEVTDGVYYYQVKIGEKIYIGNITVLR